MNKEAVQHERGPRNSTIRRQVALYLKESAASGPSPLTHIPSHLRPLEAHLNGSGLGHNTLGHHPSSLFRHPLLSEEQASAIFSAARLPFSFLPPTLFTLSNDSFLVLATCDQIGWPVRKVADPAISSNSDSVAHPVSTYDQFSVANSQQPLQLVPFIRNGCWSFPALSNEPKFCLWPSFIAGTVRCPSLERIAFKDNNARCDIEWPWCIKRSK